jgi:hypothetical protein
MPLHSAYHITFIYVPAAGDPPSATVKLKSDSNEVTVSPSGDTTDVDGVVQFSVTWKPLTGGTAVKLSIVQDGANGPKADGDEIASGSFTPKPITIGNVLVKPSYQVVVTEADAFTTYAQVLVTPTTARQPVPNYVIGLDINGNFIASDSTTNVQIEPSSDDRYYMVSNQAGAGVMNIAGITAGIFPVTAGVGDSNSVSATSYLTFIPRPGEGGGNKLPLIIEGENNGQLNLDAVKTSYVTIYADSRSINRNHGGYLNPLSMTVVIINDKVVGQPIALETLVSGIPIPKTAFKTAAGDNDNVLYWMASDVNSTQPSFSNTISVAVSGNADNHPPAGGTLPAPRGPNGISIINDEVLALGDLVFTIPRYSQIAAGDVITLSAYINAYETGSGDGRSGIVPAKDVTVTDPTTVQSATILAANLVGYNASKSGILGIVEVYYSVKDSSNVDKGYSKVVFPPLQIATT